VFVPRATDGPLWQAAGRRTPCIRHRRNCPTLSAHLPCSLSVGMGSCASSPALMGSGEPDSQSTSTNRRILVRHGQDFSMNMFNVVNISFFYNKHVYGLCWMHIRDVAMFIYCNCLRFLLK
jgi:hypothetical protein